MARTMTNDPLVEADCFILNEKVSFHTIRGRDSVEIRLNDAISNLCQPLFSYPWNGKVGVDIARARKCHPRSAP